MKQSLLLKLCQFACIASFFFLLSHSGLVLFYAKKGLYSWAVSVLPVLLPFIILSRLWMYYKVPSLFFGMSRKILPGRQKEAMLTALFLLGLCSGFPIGAVFIRHFYEEGLLDRYEAEELLPLCSFVSPMFLIGYIRPLTGYEEGEWNMFAATAYLPLVMYFILFLTQGGRRHTGTARPLSLFGQFSSSALRGKAAPYGKTAGRRRTESKKREEAQASSLRGVWLSSLEIIFTIGIYMMLFTVLFGLALHVPALRNTAAEILLSNLEITTGAARIAQMASLPDALRGAAMSAALSVGGLCAMAQVYSVIAESGLSMKRYIAVKGKCAALSSLAWLLIQLVPA